MNLENMSTHLEQTQTWVSRFNHKEPTNSQYFVNLFPATIHTILTCQICANNSNITNKIHFSCLCRQEIENILFGIKDVYSILLFAI